MDWPRRSCRSRAMRLRSSSAPIVRRRPNSRALSMATPSGSTSPLSRPISRAEKRSGVIDSTAIMPTSAPRARSGGVEAAGRVGRDARAAAGGRGSRSMTAPVLDGGPDAAAAGTRRAAASPARGCPTGAPAPSVSSSSSCRKIVTLSNTISSRSRPIVESSTSSRSSEAGSVWATRWSETSSELASVSRPTWLRAIDCWRADSNDTFRTKPLTSAMTMKRRQPRAPRARGGRPAGPRRSATTPVTTTTPTPVCSAAYTEPWLKPGREGRGHEGEHPWRAPRAGDEHDRGRRSGRRARSSASAAVPSSGTGCRVRHTVTATRARPATMTHQSPSASSSTPSTKPSASAAQRNGAIGGAQRRWCPGDGGALAALDAVPAARAVGPPRARRAGSRARARRSPCCLGRAAAGRRPSTLVRRAGWPSAKQLLRQIWRRQPTRSVAHRPVRGRRAPVATVPLP